MQIVVITLFPEMFTGILSESILKRGMEKGLFEVDFVNLRDYGLGPRKQVDDTPYGGGAGMVLRVDVMAKAIEAAIEKLKINPEIQNTKDETRNFRIILLTPQGQIYNQKMAKKFADSSQDMILICGHYEGFDERIRSLVDTELSIGKFVLTGGEIPAMAVIDSVARLIPGVLGKEESTIFETFSDEDEIEYPQYTRPEEWRGVKVPDILLSGNHQRIEQWRKEQSQEKTEKYRKEQ